MGHEWIYYIAEVIDDCPNHVNAPMSGYKTRNEAFNAGLNYAYRRAGQLGNCYVETEQNGAAARFYIIERGSNALLEEYLLTHLTV